MDLYETWRQDPDIGTQALKVAQALCELAREHSGTYTFDYAGYQRVVVRRDTDRGITAEFLTSKPEAKVVERDRPPISFEGHPDAEFLDPYYEEKS